ncbi:DUF418 domain-containing protein [Oceanicaulis sp. MMSF_3324]|uniref:DUF418 domain-containing protein n=1 Tax=Oceanicaulis sp. MMSF_3324 TaxID=3046702 RepID=UPI00273E8820|nr:DUF418 domain-containing protein [Oceanicaulis sp. MMSF_3324]
MRDRIRVLDALRGFAVLGLLIAHFPSTGGTNFAFSDPRLLGEGPMAMGLWATQAVFIDAVMRGVFAALFGASMSILLFGSGDPLTRRAGFVIRCIGLFILGLLHMSLLAWSSDILAIYAVAGMGVLILSWLPPRYLFACAAVGWAVVVFYAGYREIGTETPSYAEMMAVQAAHAEGYWPHVQASVETWIMMMTNASVLGRIAEAGGYMLLGLGLMRAGALNLSGQTLQRVVLGSGLIGVSLALGTAIHGALSGFVFDVSLHPVMRFSKPFIVIFMLAGFVLAMRAPMFAQVSKVIFEPVGKMALTGYMGSSLMMLWLFTGFGLNLYGQFDRVALWGLMIPASAVVIIFSNLWLSRFKQGPLEKALRVFIDSGTALIAPLIKPRNQTLPAE